MPGVGLNRVVKKHGGGAEQRARKLKAPRAGKKQFNWTK